MDYYFEQRKLNYKINQHEKEIAELSMRVADLLVSPREASEEIERRLHTIANLAEEKKAL